MCHPSKLPDPTLLRLSANMQSHRQQAISALCNISLLLKDVYAEAELFYPEYQNLLIYQPDTSLKDSICQTKPPSKKQEDC